MNAEIYWKIRKEEEVSPIGNKTMNSIRQTRLHNDRKSNRKKVKTKRKKQIEIKGEYEFGKEKEYPKDTIQIKLEIGKQMGTETT